MKHTMSRRILAVALAAVMLLGLLPTAFASAEEPEEQTPVQEVQEEAPAEETPAQPEETPAEPAPQDGAGSEISTQDVTTVSTWAALQTAFNNGGDIVLGGDIIASGSDAHLVVPSGAIVTLDLAGHTLSRNRATATDNYGDVITVAGGNLTVNDSSDSQSGKITGGKNMYYGGGVHVNANGSFTLNAGSVCNNYATRRGGGVYVTEKATFIMNGGSITGNKVDVSNGEVFSGGGIYINPGCTVILGGNATVKDNKKNVDASSVADNNVYLPANATLTLSSTTPLTADASIGITTASTPSKSGTKVVTGEKVYKYLKNFTYDGGTGYIIGMRNNREDLKNLYCAPTPSDDNPSISVPSAWELIQIYLKDGESYTMTENVTAGEDDTGLTVRDGATVTLDLNGYTLNRNLSSKEYAGNVISVDGGQLTLQDSSPAQTGKITGGYASTGGGVIVYEGATLIMTGGTVTGNMAEQVSGGVHVEGTFIMTGGKISDNTAGADGGGVYVYPGDDEQGYAPGSMTVGGTAVIENNTANGELDNVRAATLTLSRDVSLADGAKIGVTPILGKDVTAVPADGLAIATGANGSAADCAGKFTSDVSGYFFGVKDGDGDNIYLAPTSSETVKKPVSAWQELQTAFNDGIANIFLTRDVTAGDSDICLTVPSGKTVTLDLAGHTVDRGLANKEDYDSHGSAISLMGSNLTVTDTSADKDGKITGGNEQNKGGGVDVADNSSLTLQAGSITGNKSRIEGAGVYVGRNSSFTMTGGSITGNISNWNGGGGVHVDEGCSFTMTGGEISGNKALNFSGGGVYVKGSFTMTGGSITGNWTSNVGGGVFMYNGDAVNFTVGGDGVIANNIGRNDTASNVALAYRPLKLDADNPLKENAKIGITAVNTEYGSVGKDGFLAVTGATGSATEYTGKYFFSDNENYILGAKDGNNDEIYLMLPANVSIAAGDNMSKADNSGELTQKVGVGQAITSIVFTAKDGYYFPENYAGFETVARAAESNGLTVKRDSDTQITVSGKPTGDVKLKLADAVQKTRSVTITAGDGMEETADSGKLTQTVAEGAEITPIVLKAKDGYYFPENYTGFAIVARAAESSGLTVKRDSDTQITISGTPTGDVNLTLADAVQKTWNVSITHGEHMTVSGDLKQTVVAGSPMKEVTFTAEAGYWFGESTVTHTGDISIKYSDDGTVITVFGTPTSDAEVNVSAATLKPLNVKLAPGDHMTASGDLEQKVAAGAAMKDVTFTADDGYYFPEDYEISVPDGITVTRSDDGKTITISGTPKADLNLTLTAAEQKPDDKPEAPKKPTFVDGQGNVIDNPGSYKKGETVNAGGGLFDGWFDENGNELTDVANAKAGVTYTARWRLADKATDTVKTGDAGVTLYIGLASAALLATGAAVLLANRKRREE